MFFVPPLRLPALLLFFEECSLHCSWPHEAPQGTQTPLLLPPALQVLFPLKAPAACSISQRTLAWAPGSRRCRGAEGLEIAFSLITSFLQVRSEEVSVPRVAGQVPWRGSSGASLSIHLLSPSKPPCLQHAKAALPVDLRRCRLEGLDVMCERSASEGMLPAKAGSPWRHLCPPQALRVALCPSRLVLGWCLAC